MFIYLLSEHLLKFRFVYFNYTILFLIRLIHVDAVAHSIM